MKADIEFEPLTISVDRTCAILGLGRTKLYQILAEGKLTRVKIGRRTLITIESVKRLISQA